MEQPQLPPLLFTLNYPGWDCRYGAEGKALAARPDWPGFNPSELYGRRRELTSQSYPLIPTSCAMPFHPTPSPHRKNKCNYFFQWARLALDWLNSSDNSWTCRASDFSRNWITGMLEDQAEDFEMILGWVHSHEINDCMSAETQQI